MQNMMIERYHFEKSSSDKVEDETFFIDSDVERNRKEIRKIIVQFKQADYRIRKQLMRMYDLKLQQQEQLYRLHANCSIALISDFDPNNNNDINNDTNNDNSTFMFGHVKRKKSSINLLEDIYIDPIVQRHMELPPTRS